nr:ATP-binding protein [Pseudarthrobacter sp. IC2-21]
MAAGSAHGIDADHAAGTDGTPLRETSTVFCTQYSQKDWHQRLGSGVHADAIMDRIIYNTIWVETGSYNMREHAAPATA